MRRPGPYRLVIRFALGSLVAFLAIGTALSVAVSRQFKSRGEEQARGNATFVTRSILRFRISPKDIQAPLLPTGKTAARYRDLENFVQSRILKPGAGSAHFRVVRIKIWSAKGVILFSDDPRLPGKRFGVEEDLAQAFQGKTESGITDLQADENVDERNLADRLFETYVPLRLEGNKGPVDAVVELYQDYASIQQEITSGFQTVALTMLIGLAALYVLLLPIAVRASKTLSVQNATLGQQARRLVELLEKEQRTVAELRELNRLKTNFVAVASHELRTPLTSIIGYAKTLRQPGFSDDQRTRDEFLEAIERQGDRLFQLVENLLATSHLEDSGVRLSISDFSFAGLVGEVVEGLGSRGGRIRVVLPNDLPELRSDRQYVAQILQNLLGNALKFSPPDTECELGAKGSPRSLAFWVSDQGIGIPADQVDKIFDRFYQIDSSSTRRFGGIGLGLSLVKTSVEMLGGTIDVQSMPGRGSTFTVTLPVIHPSVGTQDHVEPPTVESNGSNGQVSNGQTANGHDPTGSFAISGAQRPLASRRS
jgi:signal transduction histidine kinase